MANNTKKAKLKILTWRNIRLLLDDTIILVAAAASDSMAIRHAYCHRITNQTIIRRCKQLQRKWRN